MTNSKIGSPTDSVKDEATADESRSGGGVPVSRRLTSVDALRGFDMMWIVGGGAVGWALGRMGDHPFWETLSRQLRHPDWDGFTFYDLIFPLFIFLVGVSMVFSLGRAMETDGRWAAVQRILRRTLLLLVIGIFYNGGFNRPLEEIRWTGVLQRIALCYGFAGILFCYFRPKALAWIAAGLIAGYWALLTFVPVPGIGPASYAEGQNLANWFDSQFLPGRHWRDTWDPEGFLSTLPAIATCLTGVFAGLLLKNPGIAGGRKSAWLLGAGAAGVLFGWLWGFQFPINKHIWTSSFVLLTSGLSAIMLGVFYQMIDVWKIRRWAVPFVWIGMNAITIYLAHNLIRFREVSLRLFGGDIQSSLNEWIAGVGDLLVALGVLGLSFLLCWFLHRRRIFLRL